MKPYSILIVLACLLALSSCSTRVHTSIMLRNDSLSYKGVLVKRDTTVRGYVVMIFHSNEDTIKSIVMTNEVIEYMSIGDSIYKYPDTNLCKVVKNGKAKQMKYYNYLLGDDVDQKWHNAFQKQLEEQRRR